MNHLVWIILDSCRYDSFVQAETPFFSSIAPVERRFSYASWTYPAHQAFLMGMVPHSSPTRVFASEVYKKEFKRWRQRLNVPDLSYSDFIPELNIVVRLKKLGYRTIGRVSLPVLNPYTQMAAPFDDYKLMEDHNSFAEIVNEISFTPQQPFFYFLNLGETHYPYMLDDPNLPHLSGVHGVYRKLDAHLSEKDAFKEPEWREFFSRETMVNLHRQQVKAVEYCDSIFGALQAKVPENTWFIITSDHGELFGEDNYFGHGPIVHEKVFEVPFIEGPKPVQST